MGTFGIDRQQVLPDVRGRISIEFHCELYPPFLFLVLTWEGAVDFTSNVLWRFRR